MQITQELCKRPGLNRAGFDMQTIYVPNLIDKVLSFHLINTLMGKFCQQCLFRCCQIHNFGLFTYVDAIVMGSVVRSVDSAIHRIVIFQLPQKDIKAMTLGILNSQEIKKVTLT